MAAPGDVVEVAAGRYGDQRIDADPVKDGTGAEVVIRPALRAAVTITDLLSFASNVRYSGFTVALDSGGQPDIRGGHDVVVENVKATNFYVQGPTRRVTIRGGEYGPFLSSGGGSQIKTLTAGGDDPNPAAQPQQTVVDGVYFHDYRIPAGSGAHLDCLHVFFHVGVTVRNSRFERCQHYGILLGSNGPGAAEHDVIENNVFGSADVAGFALRGGYGEDFEDVLLRNNSGSSATPQTTNDLTAVRWIGNALNDLGSCRSGIAYRHNVIQRGGCSPTDLKAAPGFRDPANGDYHLRRGAPAIGRGDPASYPQHDIDGGRRPAGAAPDAGADEFGSERGSPGPRTNPPGVRRSGVAITRLGKRLRANRAGRVRLRLRCAPGGGRCRVHLSLRRVGKPRSRSLAARSARIPAGEARTVTLRLNPGARRTLRRARALRVVVRVTGRSARGFELNAHRRVRLLAPRQ